MCMKDEKCEECVYSWDCKHREKDNDVKDEKLTKSLIDVMCSFLNINNKCQEEGCDDCIKNQALEIIKAATPKQEV